MQPSSRRRLFFSVILVGLLIYFSQKYWQADSVTDCMSQKTFPARKSEEFIDVKNVTFDQ